MRQFSAWARSKVGLRLTVIGIYGVVICTRIHQVTTGFTYLKFESRSLYLIQLFIFRYPLGARWFDSFFALLPKYDERFARQYRHEPPP